MTNLELFLANVPIFRELDAEQLKEIAPLFVEEQFPAGTAILHQGKHSRAIYFLRAGRLAVRVQRPEGRETVAYLQPGAVFGELSFITGRTCSADVEVVVDAEVVYLPKEAVARLPKQRDAILRGMMTVLAERLHDTVTRGARVADSPVILLRSGEKWEAPLSFGAELARSLGRQTGRETLTANLGAPRTDPEPRAAGEHAYLLDVQVEGSGEALRSSLAGRLTSWKQRFSNVVLNPIGADKEKIHGQCIAFAETRGDLLGPGDPVTDAPGQKRFIVQSALAPTLPYLAGNSQLISDIAESEDAHVRQMPLPAHFVRVADSIARFVGDMQVGIALGGGAAWGWAHIGVLEVLERAGLPIDVVAGCSMGTVIGTLHCSGRSLDEMKEIANYWRTRTKRFIEYRVWRMHLLKEKMVRKVFWQYFGDRAVNQLEIPFWANAVDIGTGQEYTIQSDSVVDAVRASIALPGLLPPASTGNHLLVDAGIMDPVPVNLIRRMGCRYAIAVNAMAPLEATPVHKRYPFNMIDVMFRCTRIMGHEIGQARAEAAANIMMTPPMGDISMLQFERCGEIIACGRRIAEENLPAIMAGYERLRSFEPASATNEEQLKI
jgi:NTE family protein